MAAENAPAAPASATAGYVAGMQRLVLAVQELSLARDLATVMDVVRRAAREITGADGATFILRDGDRCHYADESAIAPLWKGRRFPLTSCISGWAMLNRQSVAIEDIYVDERIPHEAYRPTFVRSLAMVPVRSLDPIAAIGNYWAAPHRPTGAELELLQALADTTAVALENVQVYAELEERVRARTAELVAANDELEAFTAAVSHDLRAPIRHIDGFAGILAADAGDALDAPARATLDRIRGAAARANALIDDLLELSHASHAALSPGDVDLAALARDIAAELEQTAAGRAVEWVVPESLVVRGDARLLRVVMVNLLSNAWKFTARTPAARIELATDGAAVAVRDNGAGFDMAIAGRLFGAFERLHAHNDFPGTGIGLTTVRRVIERHGGRVWAEAAPERGATFRFTLGSS